MITPLGTATAQLLPPTQHGLEDSLRCWVEDGDDESIRKIVVHYAPLVQSTCRRCLGDGADADEAAQATFIALSQHAAAIIDSARLPVWLHRTAVRACTRLRRSQQRRRRHEQAAARERSRDLAGAPADESWERARPYLDQALASLPSTDRAALLAYLIDRVPQGDLALRSGVSREAVKKRIQRSLARLEAWYRRRDILTSGEALACGACLEMVASPSMVQGCLQAVLHPGYASPTVVALAGKLHRGPLLMKAMTQTMAGVAIVGTAVALSSHLRMAHDDSDAWKELWGRISNGSGSSGCL